MSDRIGKRRLLMKPRPVARQRTQEEPTFPLALSAPFTPPGQREPMPEPTPERHVPSPPVYDVADDEATVSMPVDILSAILSRPRAPYNFPAMVVTRLEARRLREDLQRWTTARANGVKRVLLGDYEYRTIWSEGVVEAEALYYVRSSGIQQLVMSPLYSCTWSGGIKDGEEIFCCAGTEERAIFRWREGTPVGPNPFPNLD